MTSFSSVGFSAGFSSGFSSGFSAGFSSGFSSGVSLFGREFRKSLAKQIIFSYWLFSISRSTFSITTSACSIGNGVLAYSQ